MSAFVLIHGAGDSGWSWHLVAAQLRALGHPVVVPDLPAGERSVTLTDYCEHVVNEVSQHEDLIVLGHSFGAFTAPLVADRLRHRVDELILLAGMIPAPGEPPAAWWDNSGYHQAITEQAAVDGGLTGHNDPYVSFLHDVPRALAEEAMNRGREHPSAAAMAEPWPLDTWPEVPTRFVLCQHDRFFPPLLFRRLAPERLGITPEEIAGSHCVMLSRPTAVANLLTTGRGRRP